MEGPIYVLDAADFRPVEIVLRRVYTAHILNKELDHHEVALQELNDSDRLPREEAFCPKEHERLIETLDKVRRHVDANFRVVFDGEGGPWVGGTPTSEKRKELAAQLTAMRQHPRSIPIDLYGDPYFYDIFDREPDAWLISGGLDKATYITTPTERDAEIERRQNQLSERDALQK